MEAGPPPADGDLSKGPKILLVNSILTAIAILAVSVRFLARANGHGAFGCDDWTMLLAVVGILSK